MKGRLKQPFFMNILGVLRQEGRRICRGVNAVSGGRFRTDGANVGFGSKAVPG
jgi:hypothetical protein